MSELSALFGPGYRPSPGAVYPAVEALFAEKLIERDPDNRYRSTTAGLSALDDRGNTLTAVEARTGVSLRAERDATHSLQGFMARAAEIGSAIDIATLDRVLDETIHQLEALAEKENREP